MTTQKNSAEQVKTFFGLLRKANRPHWMCAWTLVMWYAERRLAWINVSVTERLASYIRRFGLVLLPAKNSV